MGKGKEIEHNKSHIWMIDKDDRKWKVIYCLLKSPGTRSVFLSYAFSHV